MSKIQTVEQAFIYLGRKYELPDLSAFPKEYAKTVIAHYQLMVIAEALNKEANSGMPWTPNWNNYSEFKYFPWFEIAASDEQPAGFGFSRTVYDYSYTDSDVGSRLCYISNEVALYAANQFRSLYEDYFLIKY